MGKTLLLYLGLLAFVAVASLTAAQYEEKKEEAVKVSGFEWRYREGGEPIQPVNFGPVNSMDWYGIPPETIFNQPPIAYLPTTLISAPPHKKAGNMKSATKKEKKERRAPRPDHHRLKSKKGEGK